MAEAVPVDVKKAGQAWAKSAAEANGDAPNPNPVTRLANGGLEFRQGGTVVRTGTEPSAVGGNPTGYMRINTTVGNATFTQRFDREASGTFKPTATGIQQIVDGKPVPITNLSAADQAAVNTAMQAELTRATTAPAGAPTGTKPIGDAAFNTSLRSANVARPGMSVA